MTQTDPDVGESHKPQTRPVDRAHDQRTGVPVWALVISTIAALAIGGAIAYGGTQPDLVSAREETANVQAQLDEVQSELDGVRSCVFTSSGSIGTAIDDMSTDNEDMWDAIVDYTTSRDLPGLGDTAISAKLDHESDHEAAVAGLIEATSC
ncbi:hypothetical protein [uncultured Frigoribacterium sp.]|uniref:hypothetical protein n=1 Tax=uncultured Frigoribacterium sp. TaxID=335377 RepID=UPI0028D5A2E3|nr:hypothetical protein [uncultured Frigoribacterium sp.]